MLVQRFIEWSRTAPVSDRVRAVRKLCESYRFATLSEPERRTAAAVMTVTLDDRSERVRLALAEAIAPCAKAPRHVVLALARDLPAIASAMMASPVLEEADLLQLVRAGDEACTLAVASRPHLTGPLAVAIVEHGEAVAVAKLLDHTRLILSPCVLERITVRFAGEAGIRSRLLGCDALSAATLRRLRTVHASALCAFAEDHRWLSASRTREIVAETNEASVLADAAGADGSRLSEIAAQAIEEGTLTPALLLRAAVGGQLTFVEHAVALLCDTSSGKVASAFRARRDTPLRALLLRAGIAADFGRMIAAAHEVWRENARYAFGDEQDGAVRVLREVVRRLAAEVDATSPASVVRLLADFELEIERGAARDHEERLLLAA